MVFFVLCCCIVFFGFRVKGLGIRDKRFGFSLVFVALCYVFLCFLLLLDCVFVVLFLFRCTVFLHCVFVLCFWFRFRV